MASRVRTRRVRRARTGLLVLVLASACTGTAPPDDGPSSPGSPAASAGPDASGRCPPVPPISGPPPDAPRYRLHVTVDPARHEASGSLEVAFRPDAATDRLVFRLWPNAPLEKRKGARLTVSAVRAVDGIHSVRSSEPDPTTLDVFPSPRLGAGDPIRVAMRWRLRLPGAVLDRVSSDPHLAILGSFFPILAWVPGPGWAADPPTTILGETSTSPSADFDVHVVTQPNDLRVLATGAEVAPGHWVARAVRDFALAAGRLDVSRTSVSLPERTAVTVAVESGTHIPMRGFLRQVAEALVDLRAEYGPYPWPGLSVVVTPNLGRSGIEYPNVIFEGSNGLHRVTTHEVAHQWFYSLVGNDQARDPWLDEALATYASARRDGFLPFFRRLHFHGVARDHVGSPMSFWQHHGAQYEPGVYFRGVQALLALGSPTLIDCALRAYVARDAFGTATPEDLLNALSVPFPDARTRLARFGIR